VYLVRTSVSGLDLACLLVQASRAAVRRRLLAVPPGHVGIGRGLCFELGLPLVLECSGSPLTRSLLTLERGLVHALVTHARNIAPTGR
jgi:hypothetical protein